MRRLSSTGPSSSLAPSTPEPKPVPDPPRPPEPKLDPPRPPEPKKPDEKEQPRTDREPTIVKDDAKSLDVAKSPPASGRKSTSEEKPAAAPPREPEPVKIAPRGAPDGGPILGQAGTPGDSHLRRGQKGSVRQEYIAKLLRRIQAEKRYPADARQKGWEGDAEVLMTIAADGRLLAVGLKKATAFRLLDEEATDMVRRAAPFDPIPREVGLGTWKLIVPIRFRIHEGL